MATPPINERSMAGRCLCGSVDLVARMEVYGTPRPVCAKCRDEWPTNEVYIVGSKIKRRLLPALGNRRWWFHAYLRRDLNAIEIRIDMVKWSISRAIARELLYAANVMDDVIQHEAEVIIFELGKRV